MQAADRNIKTLNKDILDMIYGHLESFVMVNNCKDTDIDYNYQVVGGKKLNILESVEVCSTLIPRL